MISWGIKVDSKPCYLKFSAGFLTLCCVFLQPKSKLNPIYRFG